MNIGETIKKLRKQKDMTQEQLAEYLNISPQAISRWEINSTLPDITLVPMLANIFDVSSDTLLGIDIDAKEKRIDAIVKEAQNYSWKIQDDEAEKLLRNALKEYPNSYKLMNWLAYVLSLNVGNYDVNWNEEVKKRFEKEKKISEEEVKIIWEEIITLGEKILAECTDDNLRYWSITHLCKTYASMGETAKAMSFAKKMPDTTQRNLITETLKGTKKYNHMQTEIAHSAFNGVLNSIGLLMVNPYVSLDDGTAPYNPDECIELNHKIIDIVNILIEDGNFGDFNLDLANAHVSLTFLYAKKSDAASTLNHFRLAAKYAVIHDSLNVLPPVSKEYTSLLFRGVNFPFNSVHSQITMTELLLERSRELDSILPAAELEEIRNELRKHTAIN
ncbi:MAG: helix-turn-helix domain-containing protein [Oscillospiraceae bacterium]|nr:helix-turn-helix domain-containing protein [Oscillospiraceae bacterium]